MLEATNLDLPWKWRLNLAERTSGNGYRKVRPQYSPMCSAGSPNYILLEANQKLIKQELYLKYVDRSLLAGYLVINAAIMQPPLEYLNVFNC